MTVVVTPNPDGGRTEATYNSAGVLIELDGFDPKGLRTYRNVYDSTGRLTEQDGYDASGRQNIQILHAGDGTSTVTHLNPATAQALDAEAYRADGTLQSATNYAADGSRDVATYAVGGALSQQAGYDPQGRPVYINTYNGSGFLTEQTGYASGVRTIVIDHDTDGSENVTRYAASGSVTGQEVYDAAGHPVSSKQVASDGTYTVAQFASGQLTSNRGFSAAGTPTYANLYTGGFLTEQDGYDAAGNLVLKLLHATDGSEVITQYAAQGLVLYSVSYDPAGVPLQSIVYAADRSSTTTIYSNGQPTMQTGTAADGHNIYINKFSNGTILEQQGFSATGVLVNQIDHNADGTSISQFFSAADGHLTERVNYSSTGIVQKSIFYAGDGSTTVLTDDAGGNLVDQSGFTASGVRIYDNKYSGATLVEQDGYDANGNLTITVVHSSTGTVSSNYDITGHLTHQETYDAQGRLTLVDEYSSGRLTNVTRVLDPTAAGPGTPLTLGALTFDDEFNSLSSSPTGAQTWTSALDFGLRNPALEAEYYTDSSVGRNPFSITNGVLGITAQRVTPGSATAGRGWTSGALTTASTFAQQYGYFEVRAEMPAGGGVWPAFWMLPANHTALPELDVVETLGRDPGDVYMTSHTNLNGYRLTVADSLANVTTTSGFHTYGVNWTPTALTWYIDGVAVASQPTPPDMNTPMYLILDLAIGGGSTSFGGAADSALNSATMLVDYVRAYANAYTTNATSIIYGTSGNDTLTGKPGNNTFISGSGNDVLTGGNGQNTVVIDANWNNGEITVTSNGWIITTATGVDTLIGIQSVHLNDATITLGAGFIDIYDATNKHIEHDTFGSSGQRLTAALYNSDGSVASVDTFNSSGVRTATTINNADGSTTRVTYGAAQNILTQSGFDPSGLQTYGNIYDATGRLIEQDGYTAGHKTLVLLYAADGSSQTTHISSTGQVTDIEYYNASNVLTQQVLCAADGSYTVTMFDAAGHTHSLEGFTAAGVPIYQNIYDTAGRLTEQDGYDSAGHNVLITTIASDGLSVVTHKSSAGVVTDIEHYASGGALTLQTIFASDGSSTVNHYAAAGYLSEQDGISASGVPTYSNFYDSSGRTTEQDGYDSAGHETLVITHAADNSSITFNYDATGLLVSEYKYDASNNKYLSLVHNSGGGYDIVSYANNVTLTGTSGSDVFAGGGASQIYQFSTGFGQDTIQNFHAGSVAGHDVLQIDHTIFANYAALIAHTSDVNGHAEINAGNGNVIDLLGVHTSGFVSADFVFI